MRIQPSFWVEVDKVEELADKIKRFTLVPIDAEDLLPFHPGAHIETTLQTSDGPLRRHYSLCSSADTTAFYQVAIRFSDSSRGGSSYWHTRVKEGDRLEISAPINHFALSPVARHHVFVAGGIGITPFIPMILEASGTGKSFELHYAAKSPEQCAFHDWLEANFADKVHFYFSCNKERMIPAAVSRQRLGTHIYLCGPQSMMKDFRDAAHTEGYPKRCVHMEAFQAATSEDNKAFLVRLQQSKRELTVTVDQTLLIALRDAGIVVPSSCEVGGCGTCLLDVVDGQILHRDFYLTEDEQAENRQIISCVSRAKDQCIVLDL